MQNDQIHSHHSVNRTKSKEIQSKNEFILMGRMRMNERFIASRHQELQINVINGVCVCARQVLSSRMLTITFRGLARSVTPHQFMKQQIFHL